MERHNFLKRRNRLIFFISFFIFIIVVTVGIEFVYSETVSNILSAQVNLKKQLDFSGCLFDDTILKNSEIASARTIKLGSFNLICPTTTVTPTPGAICTEDKVDIILIVDTSGSMGAPEPPCHINCKTKLVYTKEALYSIIDKLIISGVQGRGNVRLGLVSYNNRSWLNASLTTDFSLIKQEVTNLSSAGMTCIYCGLKTANENNTNASVKKVNVLMSDGEANVPDFTAEEDAINEANRGRATGIEFYTISYGINTNPFFMKIIANTPSEKYYRASPTNEEIEETYIEIFNSICS